MTNDAHVDRIGSTALWTVCLLVGAVVAFLGAFGVLSALASWGLVAADADATLRWDLALLLGVMGGLGVGAVLMAGRLAFGAWPKPTFRQLLVPAVGVAVAIAVELALHAWATAHIGMYEFDHVMPTAILSFVTILVGLGAFAVLIAPPGAALIPLLGSWVAAGAIVLIAVSNVPGVTDGVEPESWPLAILIGVAMLYAIAVVVIAIRRGEKPSS